MAEVHEIRSCLANVFFLYRIGVNTVVAGAVTVGFVKRFAEKCENLHTAAVDVVLAVLNDTLDIFDILLCVFFGLLPLTNVLSDIFHLVLCIPVQPVCVAKSVVNSNVNEWLT